MSFLRICSENWELICICLGIAVNALGLVCNIVKYVRSGGKLHAQQLSCLLEAARTYECEAELIEGADGAEKLEYVLSRMRQYTAEMGYVYDEAALIRAVEADIAFSKRVNATKSEWLE